MTAKTLVVFGAGELAEAASWYFGVNATTNDHITIGQSVVSAEAARLSPVRLKGF